MESHLASLLPNLEAASDEDLGAIRDTVVKKLAERALAARTPGVRDDDIHNSVNHYQS